MCQGFLFFWPDDNVNDDDMDVNYQQNPEKKQRTESFYIIFQQTKKNKYQYESIYSEKNPKKTTATVILIKRKKYLIMKYYH